MKTEQDLKLSKEVINKLMEFDKSQELRFEPHEAKEFQKWCQSMFQFRVDLSCGDCIARNANKVIKYLKENS